MRRRGVLLILLRVLLTQELFAPATLQARSTATRSLTLAQAVSLAARHNATLRANAIDVRIAEARVVEASGLDDFVLSAEGAWLTDTAIGQQLDGATQRSSFGSFHSFRLTGALIRPLPTGGSVGLQLHTELTRFRDPPPGTPSQWFSPTLALMLGHPLLRGAGTNVARADRRRAHARKDVATLQKTAVLADVLRQVSQAYWDLHFAAAQLRIRRASLALAGQQLRAVQANISVGKQPPSAAAEIEVAIALRRTEALAAERQRAQSASALRQLIGRPIEDNAPILVPVDSPTAVEDQPSAVQSLNKAMARNPELLVLQQRRRLAQIDVDVAEDDLLPQLDLSVSAGPTAAASTVDAAFSGLAHFSGYQVRAALTFNQPIGRRGATGHTAVARATRQKIRLQQRDLTTRIRLAVANAVDCVRIARRQIDVLRNAAHFARLDLQAERARFVAGRSSSFDVLRRQDGLATAQLRQARAVADYQRARAELEALTGEILDRHRARAR